MEIVEGLCDSSSFECNRMVEEHEEHFETWWFKRWVLANANIVKVGWISPVDLTTLGCNTTGVKDGQTA